MLRHIFTRKQSQNPEAHLGHKLKSKTMWLTIWVPFLVLFLNVPGDSIYAAAERVSSTRKSTIAEKQRSLQGGGGGDGGGGPPDMESSSCGDDLGEVTMEDGTVPSHGECMTWSANAAYSYPEEFEILNTHDLYECPTSEKRIIVSNAIPDHDSVHQSPTSTSDVCEVNFMVVMPLNPSLLADDAYLEVPSRDILGMSLTGIPAYGPQEMDDMNALEPLVGDFIVPASGHATPDGNWHYHSGAFGLVDDAVLIPSDQLIGYALDGFPIYGPVEDTSTLDLCNGIGETAEDYRYHVRTYDQVDEYADYCDPDNTGVIQWNYIIGCYRGQPSETTIMDSTTNSLPSDCVLVDGTSSDSGSDSTAEDSDTESGSSGLIPTVSMGLKSMVTVFCFMGIYLLQ